MTEITGHESAFGADCEGASHPVAESSLQMAALRPLMEGARARGVADACELLGIAAVLLDRSGAVLHLSSAARASLGEALRVVGGHIVGSNAQDNQVVERLVARALSGSAGEEVVAAEAGAPMLVRVLPMPGARDDDAQLLKAVLFVDGKLARVSGPVAPAETACAA